MLSLLFFGYFNSNLKINITRKYINIAYLNLYFFLVLLKKTIIYNNEEKKISLKFLLKKKKHSGISFNKADFKYKISKHLVSKHSQSFCLILRVFDCKNKILTYNKLNYYYKILSNVFINLSFIKQKINFKNKDFFLYN